MACICEKNEVILCAECNKTQYPLFDDDVELVLSALYEFCKKYDKPGTSCPETVRDMKKLTEKLWTMKRSQKRPIEYFVNEYDGGPLGIFYSRPFTSKETADKAATWVQRKRCIRLVEAREPTIQIDKEKVLKMAKAMGIRYTARVIRQNKRSTL